MNSFVLSLLMASPQAAEGAQSGPMGGLMQFLPFLLIIAVFYFLIIRPQSKKQKETQKMLAALKKGDRVVTIGGVHGTIQSVREKTVVVKVDDTTKIEFARSAVSSVEAVARDDDKKEIEADEAESEKK